MIDTIPVIPNRIVAELNKTWPQTQPALLSQMFEQAIIQNRVKGYALESWQLDRATTSDGEMSETIIAVFVQVSWPQE